MDEIIEYLRSVPAWYLATSEKGQPHVRPFSFVEAYQGKLWFCTATDKDVYIQLKENPRFELCAWKPGSGWLIITGEADMNDCVDEQTRLEGYLHMTGLGETYEGPEDPRLTFFSLAHGTAKMADIDGSERTIEIA